MGAARAYEITGEERWLKIVEAYWEQVVTKRGMYATGGQTCGEIWSPPGRMAARLGDKNQEHCTVYNMMRLADFLFRQSGDSRYMDYWERNLYNGIMAQGYWEGSFTHGRKSAYPTKGLLTYFLPMRAGGQKAWSSRTQDFFCCHGTLVQANAALNEGIYYEGENALWICQYLDSDYNGCIAGKKVRVRMRRDLLNGSEHFSSDSSGVQRIHEKAARYPDCPDHRAYELTVETEEGNRMELRIRIPRWTAGKARIWLNGVPVDTDTEPGKFAVLKNICSSDRIRLELPKEIRVEYLPGSCRMAAFLDGPVVLAGLCGQERRLDTHGEAPEKLLVPDNEREWGNWMDTYKTRNQDVGIRFIPLYQVGYEPYTIYFPVEGFDWEEEIFEKKDEMPSR